MSTKRNRHGRNTQAYRTAQAELKAKRYQQCQITGIACKYPGLPITYNGRPNHPHSFSAHHVVPASLGGNHTANLVPAHFGCNAAAGNGLPRGWQRAPLFYAQKAVRGKDGRFVKPTSAQSSLRTSQDW